MPDPTYQIVGEEPIPAPSAQPRPSSAPKFQIVGEEPIPPAVAAAPARPSILHPEVLPPAQRTGSSYQAAPNQPTPEERLGEMVPQAAVPALDLANRTLVQPFERAAARTAKAGGEIAEGAASVVLQPILRPELKPGAPQGDAVKAMEFYAPKTMGAIKGVGEFAGGTVGDVRNWPFFASAAARPILQKIISGGFRTMLGAGAIDGAKQLHDHWDELTPMERSEIATKTGLSAYFAADANRLRPKFSMESGPEGTRAAATVANGRAGAGIAVTPEEIRLRGGVGSFRGETVIPRGNRPAGPGLEPPTIEGQQTAPAGPPDNGASALVAAAAKRTAAARVVRGMPPVEPEPTPQGPPLPQDIQQGHISSDTVSGIAKLLVKLPENLRAQGVMEAHETLSKVLLQQGKIVGPDGQLHIIENEKQAASVAQSIINDEVARQEKEFARNSGETGKSGAATKPAAAPKETRGSRQTRSGRAAELGQAQPAILAEEPIPASTNVDVAPTIVGEEEIPSETSKPAVLAADEHDRANQREDVSTAAAGSTAAAAGTNLPERNIDTRTGGGEVSGAAAPGQGVAGSFAKGSRIQIGAAGNTEAEIKHDGLIGGLRTVRVKFDEPTQLPWMSEPKSTTTIPKRHHATLSAAGEKQVEQTAKTDIKAGEIIFGRHGATKLDQAGGRETVAGWSDESLDERGKAAAQKMAADLKGNPPTAIVTSDLPRAKETADIVGKALGVPVEADERLRPQRMPETEGKQVSDIQHIRDHYKAHPDEVPKGGESYNQAKERQDEALAEIEGMAKAGKRPLVVTHSTNLEMELGEKPEPGGIVTKSMGLKGGSSEPAKGAVFPAKRNITQHGFDHSIETGPDVGQKVRAEKPAVPRGAGTVRLYRGEADKPETLYKFGSTQANIPKESEAAKALEAARARISKADLAGDGKDIGEGGNHVTVRYGIKGDDVEGVKKYLAGLAPFEATLGKTDKFPPSEHSDGAAVIIAPIEAPELHRINGELEKHGDFKKPDFEYRPHATIAYVRPDRAERHVGMELTKGKQFTVSEIAITDRQGKQEVVKLAGEKPAKYVLPSFVTHGLKKGEEKPKFTVKKADIVPTPEGSYEARPHAEEPKKPGWADIQKGKTSKGAAALTEHLLEKIAAGEMPKDNPALKKLVDAFDGKPADPARMKQAQEALEVAVVQRARDIVDAGENTRETFDKLVDLYNSQPNLNIRTSTSIENQAYSTPAPLAYLADKLAGVDKNSSLYEPTAGNGMLTIAANPKKTRVNELNPERMAALQKQGYQEVTQRDAAEAWSPAHKATLGKAYDAVVANPPFGSVKDAQGKATKERVDGYKIGQIDHLIAARALDAMKDDGKATLILGANKFTPGGQSTDDNIFLNWLYSHYDVSGHFEIEGKLYGRQGAAWPVRVIAIGGRQTSSAIAPPVESIQRLESWDQVYEQFSEIMAAEPRPARERGADSSLQRQPADESQPVRNTPGAAPEKTDRGRPGAGAAGAVERSGESVGPVSDRNAGRDGRVAVSDPSLRPDADIAHSDRLEKGHKPESRPERVANSRPDNGSPSAISPKSNDFQTPYTPASEKKDANVLIPVNMKSPLEQAMNVLEDEVGNLDKYVAKELGYPSVDDLHNAFMGLQVDSVAAAIHEIQQGKAIVIADQTGIGKGRQAAAIIRWAAKKGDIPVFITKAPSLFTDMYGDLSDIGTDDVNPFIVNSDEWITRPDGSRAFANKPNHRKLIEQIRNTGTLPAGRNAVFLTYSQVNVHNAQQGMLMSLARKAIFVLDESHNAGGSSNTGDFLRGLLADAKGVTYLSATYAKRPDNMPLYFKTDMGEAIGDSGTLVQAMKDGGLPLQTVVSNNLVKAGQMFRRERSYDGISMATKVDTEHRAEHTKIADGATSALRAIVDADKSFHTTYVGEAQKAAVAENKANKIVGGGNEAGKSVHHTEFSSVVHNFVRQMLLGIKANTAADDAIASIKRGEKPVIAVDNTMGSFLSAYVGDKGLQPGDRLEDFDYRNVLSRALDRSRYLQITDAMGNKTKKYVPLDELDPVTRHAYDDAQKTIDKLKIDLPVSPIDWIRQRIEDAGYTVAEITGRNLSVDYSNPEQPKLSHVPLKEQNDKVETIRRFNDGRLDSLLLNVAGSTGISAHASEKFKDQKPRHMIVAQPAQDINIFMQMLGRINRTGQVRLPGYTILNADLPAEKRPTALLSKKMKSLNANTSSNTESATSVKAADMLNKYGDQIVGNYLGDNAELASMLHVTPLNEDGSPTEDIARKATGRLAILPVKVQEAFYNEVEQQYNDYIAYLDSTNQNELEPKTFDYDAKETRGYELVAATNPASPFGEAATYGEYSIKSQGKPLAPDEVTASIKEHLDGKTPSAHSKELIEKLDGELTYYKQTLDPASPTVGQSEIVARTARDFIRDHEIGSTWRVEINGDLYNAAVVNIRSTHKGTGNPFALSKINVTLATNGSLRTLAVPATQVQRIEERKLYDKPEDIFRGTKAETRETAKIITGNLLAAYGELTDTRGTIINFTKADGTTEQGILLPKKFDFSKNTKGDYRLRDAAHALKFLRKTVNPRIEDMGIASRDGNVRVVNDAGKLAIVTPRAKARGGKYFLDHGITDLTGDFVSQQNTMRAAIPKGKETQVIEELLKKTTLYASPSMAEEAKSFAPKEAPAPKAENLLTGESGEANLSKLGEAAVDAAGAVKSYLTDVKAATKIARDIEHQLETLETRKDARKLRARDAFLEAKKAGLTKADDEAIYHHLEDQESDELTDAQENRFDDMLPIAERNEKAYTELTAGGVPLENYVHRTVKGKGGALDRIAQKIRTSVGGKGLSKSAPQTKTRTMMAIENDSGDRRVISIKGGHATMWQEGEPTELGEIKNANGRTDEENETFPEGQPNSAFYDKGKIVEGPDGYDWKVVQATTREIEDNTDMEYYHSALASLLVSNIQLESALDAMHFIEGLKASPEFKDIAWKGSGNPPKGWKSTQLPQFHGYYFEPRTSEVLDRYADSLKGGEANVLDQVGKFMRLVMLLNPLMHAGNVGMDWLVEKGLHGFFPTNYVRMYRTSSKALHAVLTKNDDFKAALDAGAALQSHRELTQDVTKLFYERLAEGLGKKEPWAMRIADAIGLTEAKYAYILGPLKTLSNFVAWHSSDFFLLQSAYEKQAKGMSFEDALADTVRILADYRVPTRIADSTMLSKAFRSPKVFIFGPWHYHLLKAPFEMGKAALGLKEPTGDNSKAGEVGTAWSQWAMLALLMYGILPWLDDKAKELGHDAHLAVKRFGLVGFMEAVDKMARREAGVGATAQRVLMPSPLLKGGMDLLNNRESYSGRNIVDPHATWSTQRDELGHYVIGEMGQIGQAERAWSSAEQRKKFWLQQLGLKSVKTPAERVAADIAMTKVGTEAVDPEEQQVYSRRREILDALRKGDSKPLSEARAKHQITLTQEKQLRERARLTPLQDTVHGFSYSEIMRVYEAAKRDGDKKAMEELHREVRQKRMNLLEKGERAETEKAEAAAQ